MTSAVGARAQPSRTATGQLIPGQAAIRLLNGGHFLLESHLDAAVALIRPFLERTAAA